MSYLKYFFESLTRIYLIVELNLTCPLGYFRTNDDILLNLSTCFIFCLEISSVKLQTSSFNLYLHSYINWSKPEQLNNVTSPSVKVHAIPSCKVWWIASKNLWSHIPTTGSTINDPSLFLHDKAAVDFLCCSWHV